MSLLHLNAIRKCWLIGTLILLDPIQHTPLFWRHENVEILDYFQGWKDSLTTHFSVNNHRKIGKLEMRGSSKMRALIHSTRRRKRLKSWGKVSIRRYMPFQPITLQCKPCLFCSIQEGCWNKRVSLVGGRFAYTLLSQINEPPSGNLCFETI